MQQTNKKNKNRRGRSERSLKLVAAVVSLLFAALMLYPMIFAISSSMKDNAKIYDVPPKLMPDAANSVSLVLDYTDMEFDSEDQMKDTMLRDNVLAMFGVNYKLSDESIMEIQVYGMKDGKTVFHSRAHQMKLQMERDYGVYKSTAIKEEVLLHGDRYLRANESIGYEFDPAGGLELPEEGLSDQFLEPISSLLTEKYPVSGTLVSAGRWVKNLLNLESFRYYLQMPGYIYPNNAWISQFGFMTFVFNSVIVIGFAMIAQVILFDLCLCHQPPAVRAGSQSRAVIFPWRYDGAICQYHAAAADHVPRNGSL